MVCYVALFLYIIIIVKLLPKRLKRAKAILSESNEKLDKLIESSPGAYVIDVCMHACLHFNKYTAQFNVETIRTWISHERNSLSSEG